MSIVRLNYLSSQQTASKFVIKDKNLQKILQEIISAHDNETRLEQSRLTGIRKVYERMNEKEKKKFIEEIRKGIDTEWLIGQKDLTKEQAKGLTDLIEKAIIFDPEKADITTAWEESFHASIVTLARPYLARNLLRENGWDGKGEIWEISKNPTLKEAHERLANKYVEWRKKQEENPTEPKTRLEKLFQLLRELWAKIAAFLNRLGFSTEAGYFYNLAKGKLRKEKEKITDTDFYKEIADAQTDFGKSIEEFKKGKLTKPAKVTSTPEILVRLGAKQLPITITPDVISKVINKHNITYEQLKDLPVELHDPLMVFESATYPNSFVVLTQLKSPDGSIVVAIHLNYSENRVLVNKIASIYSKNREEAINDWIRKGLLRYINKKETKLSWRSAGLQLPMETTKFGKSKILTEDDFVNNKLKQQLNEIQDELFPKDFQPKAEVSDSLLFELCRYLIGMPIVGLILRPSKLPTFDSTRIGIFIRTEPGSRSIKGRER